MTDEVSGDDEAARAKRTDEARQAMELAPLALMADRCRIPWYGTGIGMFYSELAQNAAMVLLQDEPMDLPFSKEAVQLANWVAEGNPPASTWNTITDKQWSATYAGWRRRTIDKLIK